MLGEDGVKMFGPCRVLYQGVWRKGDAIYAGGGKYLVDFKVPGNILGGNLRVVTKRFRSKKVVFEP